MFAELARQHKHEAADREQEANLYNWLGETERVLPGNGRDAARADNQALAIQRDLHAQQPAREAYTQELARTYYNRGILRSHLADRAGADADYLQASSLLMPLSSSSAANRQELDRVYNNRANLLDELGRTAEAEALYRQAIDAHVQLLKASPSERDYELELAEFCDSLALLYFDTDRLELAERWWRESHKQIQQLASAAPSVVLKMAKSDLVHASIAQKKGDAATAAGEYQRSVDLLAAMNSGELETGTMEYHVTQGEALDALARIHLVDGNGAAAIPLLSAAIQQNQAAGKTNALAWDYANLARAQLDAGLTLDASKNLQNLRALLPGVTGYDKAHLTDQEKVMAGRLSVTGTRANKEQVRK